MLHQQKHPIAFYSKKLCVKVQNSSTYVRELHAIALAIYKWCQYLLGNKFMTDKKTLKDLMTQVAQTPNQHYY